MDQSVSFGDWVRHRRKILDMTQADLAQRVNCSLSILRKIERDQQRPSDQLAELLAEHLAIDDAQRPQFIQMARGRYVPDMPLPAELPFDQSTYQQPADRRPISGNPFIISSGAVLLLVIFLLLLSGAYNDGFGPAPNGNIGESSQPSDMVIAGQNGTEIENKSDSPTPIAANETAAKVVKQPFAGTTVTIGGPFQDHTAAREEAVRPFEKETGINIKFIHYGGDFEDTIAKVIESGLTPDIIDFPQPGYMAEYARQGEIVDVRTFMDKAFLREQYNEALLEAAMVGDQMPGIWHLVSVKSLVWYPKPAFEEAGYQIPATWEEMMALTDQIAADGATPWCIGIESAGATGWVGTDWLENILLRTQPGETYDAWVAGELPFDSPEIRNAFEIMAAIWLEDDHVYGGTAAIATERFYENAQRMFEEPPGCFLHSQGSFIQSSFPEGLRFGEDYDFFFLPSIDEEFGRPVLDGGDLMAMFNDRPEVRETMRWLATGESVRPFVESGSNISPHRDAPFEWYSSPAQLKIAQVLLDADTYRFDGSDMMPGAVGAGSFWQGIVDWVEGEDLDVVLKRIDDSWPERP